MGQIGEGYFLCPPWKVLPECVDSILEIRSVFVSGRLDKGRKTVFIRIHYKHA